jgi:hypothetical protein
MTDVTIRGIDDEVYARFTGEAKKRGLSIGELTTIVMRALVEETSTRTYRIGDLAHLSVTRKDLESLEGMVSFFEIKSLEFDDQISWEMFDRKIGAIANVANLKIPPGVSRFQALTKCRAVAKVS